MSVSLGPTWRNLFALVVLTFLLPFFTVSCNGQTVMTMSGFNAAGIGDPALAEPFASLAKTSSTPAPAGRSVRAPTTGRESGSTLPWALLALGSAVVGLVVGLVRRGVSLLAPMGLAGLGAVGLLGLKMQLENALRQSMQSNGQTNDLGAQLARSIVIEAHAQPGYWLALLGFLIIAAGCGGVYWLRRSGRELTIEPVIRTVPTTAPPAPSTAHERGAPPGD